MPTPPSFLIHTGDVRAIVEAGGVQAFEDKGTQELPDQDVFYVPGEHDVLNDGGELLPGAIPEERRSQGFRLV